MEFLQDSLDDWLGENLAAYGDDDYLLFDCPGQVELYSHVTAFKSLADYLTGNGWHLAAVYCMDVQFAGDPAKFVGGCLAALGAMVQLELPHVNVLTKVDLLPRGEGRAGLDRFLIPDGRELGADLAARRAARGGGGGGVGGPAAAARLDAAVCRLLDDWSMLAFVPLDRGGGVRGGGREGDEGEDDDGEDDEGREGEGVAAVLAAVDNAIQWGEDADVRIRDIEGIDDGRELEEGMI